MTSLRRLPAALLPAVLILLALAVPAAAQAPDEVSDTEQRLRALREQIAADEALLTETARAEEATLETLQQLDRELALRTELSGGYEQRLRELAHTGDSLRAVMEQFSEDLGALRNEYRRYAVHGYKYGRMHDLALILSASSINQMLIRVRYLNRFADQRKRKLDAIRAATEELEDRRTRMAEMRVQTQLLLQQAREERLKMERLQRSRETVIRELRSQRTSLEEKLSQQRQAASTLEGRLRDLARAADARRRESVARNPSAEIDYSAASGSFLEQRGRLPWPAEGAVVEPFGDLVNPVHGTRTPNPGILIATKAQAEVRAVFGGTVLSVSVLPEFGTFVAIAHGAYQSVYSNFSMVYVSEGQTVKPGQIIGRAGTEAEPKQAGIFFGLFKDGVPFDPTPWLRRR